ncbi:MAG: hypothetical protein ACFFBH_13690 [Promethearchaeota archaeon]
MFAIFGVPLLFSLNPIQFGFDDILLIEVAIFGTIIFGFQVWSKPLQFLKHKLF